MAKQSFLEKPVKYKHLVIYWVVVIAISLIFGLKQIKATQNVGNNTQALPS
jgi:hypothetical protein